MNDRGAGAGWVAFAAIMILIAGILNIIWGIAAISSSHFFVNTANYIVSDLTTWGWVALVIGVLELFVSYSILTGGRVRALGRRPDSVTQRDLGAAIHQGVPALGALHIRHRSPHHPRTRQLRRRHCHRAARVEVIPRGSGRRPLPRALRSAIAEASGDSPRDV